MAAWVCTSCNSINEERALACSTCGATRGGDGGRPPAGFAPAAGPAESTFATPQGATLAAPTAEPILPSAGGLVGGLLGGLVAAIGATVIWYVAVILSGWQVGLVAIVAGWLVARGVLFGAEGRGSMPLVAISAVFTLLALGVSEYLIVMHFVNQELTELAAGFTIDVIQPLEVVVEVIVESLAADPLTLLFWGIALFQAVVIPFRAIARPAPTA